MHSGNRCVPCRVKGFHPIEECGYITTWRANHTGANRQGRKCCTNEAVDMKEWHDVQASILLSQLERRLNVVSGCANVRVSEGNNFRP